MIPWKGIGQMTAYVLRPRRCLPILLRGQRLLTAQTVKRKIDNGND